MLTHRCRIEKGGGRPEDTRQSRFEHLQTCIEANQAINLISLDNYIRMILYTHLNVKLTTNEKNA